MRRRGFITLIGGAAAWPLAARAQQASGMRRVGVLMGYAEDDSEAKVFFAAFTQRLAELGWVEGRNLRMDVRWAPGSVDRMRTFARQLVELQPDVILANSTPATAALQRETRTIPIVFAVASDPVGSGFAASLARPGGNITGFSIAEPSLPGKWLELLTEIAPISSELQ
jgi:putative tryptophan/tyrosine transport system substrate-binding protein